MLNMISWSLITIAGFVWVALLYILLRSMFYTPPVDPHTKSIKWKIISINPTYINNKNSESAYTYINPLSAGISSLFVTFIGMHFKEYHIVGECKFHNELYTKNSYILWRNIQLQMYWENLPLK